MATRKRLVRRSGKQLLTLTTAAASALAGIAAPMVHAGGTTLNWNGSAGDGAWSNSINWTNVSGPDSVPGDQDIAQFNQNSASTNIAVGTVSLNTLNFGDTTAYTLNSGTLSFDTTGGITLMSANSASQTLSNSLAVVLGTDTSSDTFAFTNNSAVTTNALIVNGGITGLASAGNVDTLSLSGAGNMTLGGIVGNGAGGGTVSLVQSSTGTTTLSGANSFTGGLAINSGTIIGATSNTAFGAASNVITLGLQGGGPATLLESTSGSSIANPISLASRTTGTLTIGNTGTGISTTFTGGVTGGNDFTINENATTGTITFSTGLINNAGTITNVGAGTGTTTINSVIGANVTSVIENSTTSALALTANNAAFAGVVLIKAGSVTAGAAVGNSVFGTGTIQLGDTAADANNVSLQLNTTQATFANAITLNSGTTGTITLGSSNSTTSQAISGGVTGTNNLTISDPTSTTATLTFSGLVNNAGTLNNISAGTGAIIFSGGVGANVTSITESSATSPLTISTAALSINSGGTTLINNAASGTTALLTVSGGITGTGSLTLKNNNSTVTNGITLSTGSVNNAGTITNSGTGTGVSLISSVIGTNVTGVFENSATSPLTISGTANTYTSATTITSGILNAANVVVASGASGLGNATSAVILGGASTKGTLVYTGAAATYTRNFTINAGGGEVDSTTAVLTINTPISLANGPLTFGGANGITLSTGTAANFTGTFSLTKTGAGTAILQTTTVDALTTTPLFITAGTLTSNVTTSTALANPLGTGAISITPGATLNTTEAGQLGDTFANPFTIVNAAGTATISDVSGGAAYSGAVTFAAGANGPILKLTNTNGTAATLGFSGGFTGPGSIQLNGTGGGSPISLSGTTVNNAGTISNVGTNAAGVATITAVIGANVTGVIENGTAPMTLSPATPNLYSGPTTVTAGTLTATTAGAIPSTSAVTLNGGTLTASTVAGAVAGPITVSTGTLNNNFAGAISSNISMTGGTFAQTAALNGATQTLTVSGGTANLNQANTYGGVTTVSGGTLNASVAGAVPGTMAVSVTSGTLNASATGALAGAVTMTGGTLNTSSTAGSGNGTNTITLNGGTIVTPAVGIGVLGGILGTVNGGSAANTISPGGAGNYGQLNLAALSTGAGTVLQLDVYTPWSAMAATTGDLLDVTGPNALTFASGTTVNFPSGVPSIAGDYRLIQFNGSVATLANLTVPASTSRDSYAYDTSVDSGYIDLVVTSLGGGATTSNWIDTTTGTNQNWSVPGNWSTGVVPQFSGDVAILDSAIAAAQTINLNGQIHVGSLTFNPNAGSGASTLTYAIAANGTDNLSFDNGTSAASVTNSFNNNTIGVPVFLVSSTNASVASGTTLTVSGAVQGTGGLTLAAGSAGGTLTLSGTNTFTGGLEADSGVINVPTTNLTPLGGTTSGSGNVMLNGGTLSFSAGTTQLTTVAGQVFTIGPNGGTIIAGGAGTTGKFFLTGAGTLVGGGVLTKSGGADMQVTSANAGFTGSIVIDGGFVEDQNVLGLGTAAVTVTSAAANAALTSTVTSGSTVISTASTAGLLPGQGVSGTGIPAGAYITSVINGTSFEISAPATAAGASVAIAAETGELVGSTTAGPIANPLTISGNGIISANATGTLFTGALTVPASGTFILAPRQFQTITTGTTFTIAGNIAGPGNTPTTANLSLGTVTETSIGNVILGGNNANWTSTQGASGTPFVLNSAFQGLEFGPLARPNAAAGVFVTLTGGNFGALSDGDGTGTPNLAGTFSDTFNITAASTITVGHVGAGIPVGSGMFTTASNKTIAESTALSLGAFILTTANNNGYGLDFTNSVTLNGATFSTLTVATATSSLLTPGLTIDGPLSSTNATAGAVILTKAGAGTLLLTNTGNASSLGTSGAQIIDITAGILAANSDAALGNASDIIRLSGNSTTSGFRATSTFSSAHTFLLNSAANDMEVSTGNTLTLNSPLGIGAAADVLTKNDDGALTFGASVVNPSTWTGGISVAAGRLQLAVATNLGSTTPALVTATGGEVQLTGSGLTYGNPFSINGTGITDNGALENSPGSGNTNTISSTITQTAAATIGTDAGTTLNLTGSVAGAFGLTLAAGNGANVNVKTTGLAAAVTGLTVANNGASLVAGLPAGAVNIQVSDTVFVAPITVLAGSLNVGSSTGVGALGATGLITLNPGSSLNIIDTGGASVANRLGGRPVTSFAGTVNYTVNTTAASNETAGVYTLNNGLSTINITNAGTQTGTLTFASAAITTSSLLNVTTTGGTLGTTDVLKFTTAPPLIPATTGLMMHTTINGADFATYSTTTGVAVPAYNGSGATLISAAAATDTFSTTTSQAIGTSNAINPSINASFNQTLNALRINGNGITVGAAAAGETLNLTALEILSTGGANTLGSGLVLTVPTGLELLIDANSGASVNVQGPIENNYNLTTGGAGRVTLSAPVYYTATTNYFAVDGGTTQLAAGTQTLLPAYSTEIGPGAILDLDGNAQTLVNLRNDASTTTYVGTGGTITSSTGTGTLVLNGATGSFGGTFTGNVNLGFGGATTETLTNASNYGGGTTITGGTLNVTDAGALTGTSGIAINYAALAVTDNGLVAIGNRLGTAPITLSGGTLTYTGRAQTLSTESFGTVAVAQGYSTITVNAGGTGVNSAALTLAGLTHTSMDATLNVSGALNALGTLGAGPRLLVTPFETASPNVNNIIGGWAIDATTGEFLSYQPGFGLAGLTTNGYAGYDFNQAAFPATALPTQNLRITAASAIPAGGLTINSLSLRASFATTFTNATDVLNLVSGGLSLTQAANSLGATVDSGQLTAGGTASGVSPLYLFQPAGGLYTINSRIIDNGAGQTRVVVTGSTGANGVTLTDPNNSYTGGTVLNGGTISLAGATPGAANITAHQAEIPGGGLTINNGTVTMVTNAGQIDPTNAVTLNGGSVLTLVGANSLAGLTFNNNGGTATPAVNTGGTLSLPGGAITATSNNVNTVATLAGTVDFGGGPANLTISPIQISSQNVLPWAATLNISALVQNASSLTFSGGGNLQLSSAASTFTGGVTVSDASGLIIGASSTPSTAGSTVTAGPLGTGTLTLAGNATLFSLPGTAEVVGNNVVLNGNITFNGTQGLTLNGTVALPLGANSTMTVAAPLTVATLGGAISGAGSSITKNGYGTLTLNNTAASIFSGGVTLNNGILQAFGTASAAPTPLGTGPITVNGGQLQLHNNGAASNSAVIYGNNLTLGPATNAYIDVNNNGADTGNTIALGTLSMGAATLNVTGGNSYTLAFGGATTLTGNAVFATTTANLILNGPIGGNFGITKIGSPATTMTLNGANATFTGNVTVSVGTLDVTANGGLGTAAKTITVIPITNPTSLSSLQLDGTSGDITLPAALSFTTSFDALSGGVPIAGSGAVVSIAGNNTIQGNFTLTSGGGGTAFNVLAGSLTLNGNMSIITSGSARSVDLRGNGTGLLSGTLSDGGAVLSLNRDAGTGTWTVSGTNSYSGVTTVSAGTLAVTSLANGGSSSAVGASTNAATNLILNGGTLQYTGAAVSTDRLFSIGTTAGSALDASGTGPVNFTNTGPLGFNAQTGARTLTLTGTNVGSNTLAAVIADNTGATSVIKSGTGAWTVSGANTYTGTTSVSAGMFLVNGAHGTGATLAGNYTVASAATLGGTGTINLASTSGISITSGGTLAPGGLNNAIGALTVNSVVGTGTTAVALASGSNFDIALTHTAADELIVNNGPVDLGAGTATLNLTQDGSLLGNEQFTIVSDPNNAITGTFAGGTSGTSNGINYTLLYNTTADPESVVLTVGAVPEPTSLGLLGVGAVGLLARRRRRHARR